MGFDRGAFIARRWSAEAAAPERRSPVDRWLLWGVLILSMTGLLLVYSSSSALGLTWRGGNDLFYLQSQLLRWVVGVAVLLGLSRLDVRHLSGRGNLLFWGGMMAVLLVLILPFGPGVELRGARRWLRIGDWLVQPSEFARLIMIVSLAGMLGRRGADLRTWGGLWRPVAVVMVTAGLIAAEPHLSLGLLTAMTGFLLLFLAGGCPWRLAVIGLSPLALALLIARGYHWERIAAFLSGSGALSYQAEQSRLAIGSGGLIGHGLGKGLQKYFFLPDPHTDFILSVVGEELGLLGMLALLALTVIVTLRLFRAGRHGDSRFGELLAYGVGLQFAMGFVLHTAVCLGVAPTTGVPYPLVSFGGSALLANMMGLGMVLSLSRQSAGGSRYRPGGALAWPLPGTGGLPA